MSSIQEVKYTKISIRILEVGDILPFNIYAQSIKNNTHVQFEKIINKFKEITKLELDALSQYKSIYIDKEMEVKYSHFVGLKLLRIVTNEKITDQIKARILYVQALFILETIFLTKDSNLIDDLRAICKAISIIFLVNKEILKQFLIVANKKYTTVSHSINVGIYAAAIAHKLNLPNGTIESLIMAGFLHDLGKVDIDDSILYKAEKLTAVEFDEIKKHSFNGEVFAKELGIKDAIVLACIKEHHERLDGNGYPNHLKDEEISYYAKIIAVCDVFDALSTERTYRKDFNTFESIMTMGKEFVNHLDPVIVKTFISIMGKNE